MNPDNLNQEIIMTKDAIMFLKNILLTHHTTNLRRS